MNHPIYRPLVRVTRIIGEPMSYQDGDVREGIISASAISRLERPVAGVEALEGAIYSSPVTYPAMDEAPMSRALMGGMKMGFAAYDLNKTDHLIATFPGGKHKIVIEIFGDSAVAVAVETGHPINKSLRRIVDRAARRAGLDRAARRAGLKGVESTSPERAANESPPSLPIESNQ